MATSASPIPDRSTAYLTLPIAANAGFGLETVAVPSPASVSGTIRSSANPVGMRTTFDTCPT